MPKLKLRPKWTTADDQALMEAVEEQLANGKVKPNWREVAERVEGRNRAQCRQRWDSHLRPGLDLGPWRDDEINELKYFLRYSADTSHTPTMSEVAEKFPNRSRSSLNNLMKSKAFNSLE